VSLHLNKATLSLLVQLPEQIFSRHLPASPQIVGETLAEQVLAYVRERQLGYYPALDYFRDYPDAVDPDLLDAAEHIAWFACTQARGEIQRKLRPVFASLSFQSIQSPAFAMPAVRAHHANAAQALVRHYTPDSAKVVLQVNSIQKSAEQEAMAKWASHLVYRWLKDSFERIEITSAQGL